MHKNEMLYNKASEAIKELSEDTSVSIYQTMDNLFALQDEITDLTNIIKNAITTLAESVGKKA